MKRPWDRVDAVELVSPHDQNPAAPCEGCLAPCCWNMKLAQFEAKTWHDLEYLLFLSGFPEIELVYRGSGGFKVFYRRPCRHLDVDSGRFDCTLHGTPLKPATCVSFDETDCFYKGGMLGTPDVGLPVVRLDRARFLKVAELFTVGPDNAVLACPTPQDAWRVTRTAPKAAAISPRPALPLTTSAPVSASFSTRQSPCDDCSAPCCRVLIFDRGPPIAQHSLSYMVYQLGFEGVEIAVTDKGWRTLVRTTCQFLTDDKRCTLFGQPDRPTLCTFYNQYTCDYRRFFSAPEDSAVRLSLADMRHLEQHAPYDSAGELRGDISPRAVRQWLNARS